ncbi:TDT family transporter [Marinomonas posidonica]|uniref:C4-dicarboxylate transporter/malic acid transport protein n=1 Tax=Marinomonas posidonica (strain CECT 7376 / NCIMB 14433 / IVIA-Po-181) TaxID=491952 RepID=F6CZF3_MARPP|nr:TDT family transporter [Marinomonas posidonica]AEF54690.1 C4-dicarboxylate transporter/malic acid transport protein [Marinomonas posidonica IVIA-Po-181]
MFKRLRHRLSFAPTPMAGLALGIASLGCSWHFVIQKSSFLPYLAATIGAFLLMVLVGKFLLHPKLLIQDLQHPVVGSVVPTFAMALMVITMSLHDFMPRLAVTLWLFAIVIHTVCLATFVYHRYKNFSLMDMVPSWFVPPVGIIVAVISYPTFLFQPFAEGIFWFGIACYLVLLPLMLYRLRYCGALPDNAKPTLAIMAAPASVCLTGYLTVVYMPSKWIVLVLLVISLVKTAVIYRFSLRLLRLPFSPGYAAFTFPLAIGATALFKVQAQCIAWGVDVSVTRLLGGGAEVELAVATLVIVYVIIRYAYYYGITLQRELVFS